MRIQHVDHIGIVVNDLEAATAFFVDFGFALLGDAMVQGEWVDRVIGLDQVRAEIVMLPAPDGHLNLELSKFHHPVDPGSDSRALPNTPGLRHIAFVVEDIVGIVDSLKRKGREVFNDVQTYEDLYKLCYVRGPEGIILELAERIKK